MMKREKKEKGKKPSVNVGAFLDKVKEKKETTFSNKEKADKPVKKGKVVIGIREKLIVTGLVPIICIILLGSISYTKAAEAISENYEVSMNNAIIKTGEYFQQLFSNLEDVNYSFYNQDDLIEYYSGNLKNDPTAEVTAYKGLLNRVKKGFENAQQCHGH